MESADLLNLIELLDDNVDDLEDALAPLLGNALSDVASKMPLMDRAQLYVLVTYAIESVLFSYLRLSGVNAKEHPVFRELTRVKQYFEKIKLAESAGATPKAKLDKQAAGRFIKHALAGNEHLDTNRAKHHQTDALAAREFLQIESNRGHPQIKAKSRPESTVVNKECESESSSSYDTNSLTPTMTKDTIISDSNLSSKKRKRGSKSERKIAKMERKRSERKQLNYIQQAQA
ncbi:hypothetical protein MMC21_002300 [Puttea exsequens]|nr:hypothetical protein [Puttea exsequens]